MGIKVGVDVSNDVGVIVGVAVFTAVGVVVAASVGEGVGVDVVAGVGDAVCLAVGVAVGGSSVSTMVPTPVSSVIDALLAPSSTRCMVRSPCTKARSWIGTAIVCAVSPAAKVNVPLVPSKFTPAWAVKFLVR